MHHSDAGNRLELGEKDPWLSARGGGITCSQQHPGLGCMGAPSLVPGVAAVGTVGTPGQARLCRGLSGAFLSLLSLVPGAKKSLS